LLSYSGFVSNAASWRPTSSSTTQYIFPAHWLSASEGCKGVNLLQRRMTCCLFICCHFTPTMFRNPVFLDWQHKWLVKVKGINLTDIIDSRFLSYAPGMECKCSGILTLLYVHAWSQNSSSLISMAKWEECQGVQSLLWSLYCWRWAMWNGFKTSHIDLLPGYN